MSPIPTTRGNARRIDACMRDLSRALPPHAALRLASEAELHRRAALIGTALERPGEGCTSGDGPRPHRLSPGWAIAVAAAVLAGVGAADALATVVDVAADLLF